MALTSDFILSFLITSAVFYYEYRGIYESPQQWDQSYDFIVVGGGSGGGTVAARLSENPNLRVLLLESGGAASEYTDIPYLCSNWLLTNISWFYPTVPQKTAFFAYQGQVAKWGGGHVLGGGGTTNYMMYVRGNGLDYDEWEDRDGAQGWASPVALRYFMKSEDNRIEGIKDDGFHGQTGPVTVSYPALISDISVMFLEAARYLGYTIGDYNGADQLVFGYTQFFLRSGRRMSAESAFLRPARSRSNLVVLTFAEVTKVLFNANKRATGVQFDRMGKTYKVNANKEVIVSAGTVTSAKLLLLSGIGPEKDLNRLGISVVANLPVGRNLQDHIFIGLYFTTNSTTTFITKKDLTLDNYHLYQEHKGILTSAGFESVGFVKTKHSNPLYRAPDIQYVVRLNTPASGGSSRGWTEGINGKQEVYDNFFKYYENMTTITIFSILLVPQSFGYVTLNSSDPYVNPIIDPRYLTETIDALHLVEGLKGLIFNFSKTPAFNRLDVRTFDRPIPGCEGKQMWSDAYIECYVRTNTAQVFHYIGTNRMGNPRDPNAVVDPRLRVLGGVSGLRVVDASVMPRIPRGNTNAASIMIGERGADFIKQEWKL